MRIYITCVIKHVELEFLKLYKSCALLPPDVTTNQKEKQVIRGSYVKVQFLAVLCSLQPGVFSIGQSKWNFWVPSTWRHVELVGDKVTSDQVFLLFYSVLLC
jgi:hypothetical protein